MDKPKSVGCLLQDSGDTLQLWAFWLVAAVGGASVFLNMLQIILQGVQIAQAEGKI